MMMFWGIVRLLVVQIISQNRVCFIDYSDESSEYVNLTPENTTGGTTEQVGVHTVTYTNGTYSVSFQIVVNTSADYMIGALTVLDKSGTLLSAIPSGTFLVTVPITKLTTNNEVMVLLASYTKTGQFGGLMYFKLKNVPEGATAEITIPINNETGDMALLKAFVITSFANPIPQSAEVCFPSE